MWIFVDRQIVQYLGTEENGSGESDPAVQRVHVRYGSRVPFFVLLKVVAIERGLNMNKMKMFY